MFRLLFRLLITPLQLAYRIVRGLGPLKVLAFGSGVVAGLLLAREPGQDLRDRLRRQLEERRSSGADAELARHVREDLAQSPRTWHLPQPEVEAVEGKVVLSGAVPHATGREDIERVVSAVPGVVEVESHLAVEE